MIISRTPFRISFFGGGTDYPIWYKQNSGSVISTTINKYCYITLRHLPPFFRYNYRIRYTKRELVKNISQIKHPSVRECLKHMDIEQGVEIVHTSDLPALSGLGSSSSFTVGLLNCLYTLQNKQITKQKLAKEAILVEQNLIKENVGSQDQIAVTFGGFNKIDFLKNGSFRVTPVPMSKYRVYQLESQLMLFFTGFQRQASDVAAGIIKNIPDKTIELKEIQKITNRAFKILTSQKPSFNELGILLDEYWQLKKTLSYNVTNNKIDDIYRAAKGAGALGGKLLGAGNGGFILFYVPIELQEKVRKKLSKLLYVPFQFENTGSQTIYHMPEWMN